MKFLLTVYWKTGGTDAFTYTQEELEVRIKDLFKFAHTISKFTVTVL